MVMELQRKQWSIQTGKGSQMLTKSTAALDFY